jgi:vacuolar-type H+-ATPase subunit E/Vma4
LINLREELTDALFNEVIAGIEHFTATPAYAERLVASITDAVNAWADRFASGYVQLPARDMGLAGRIKEAVGLTAEAADDIDLGGFRLESADRRCLDNHTLAARIREERRDFSALSRQTAAQNGVV